MERRPHSLATDALPLDTIYTLLSDRRRRSAVTVLSRRDPPIGVQELATAVASSAAETDVNEIETETVRTVGAELHHVHLPKLDDTGIVDYDTATNTVTSARTEDLVAVLDPSDDGR